MKKRFRPEKRSFLLLESLREKGWLVGLKAMPDEIGWILDGSRSEYDAPCRDRLIGHGKWVCEAKWMGTIGWFHDEFCLANTPEEAVQKVWEIISNRKDASHELKTQRQDRRTRSGVSAPRARIQRKARSAVSGHTGFPGRAG